MSNFKVPKAKLSLNTLPIIQKTREERAAFRCTFPAWMETWLENSNCDEKTASYIRSQLKSDRCIRCYQFIPAVLRLMKNHGIKLNPAQAQEIANRLALLMVYLRFLDDAIDD